MGRRIKVSDETGDKIMATESKGKLAGARRVAEFREITVKVVNMLSERKINVTQRGTRAFVAYNPNGSISVLNLPYIPDDATEDLLSAIRGFLDHEVGHVLFTDPSASTRALSRLPKEDRDKVMSIINIVEDPRIETMMRRRFPGSSANLSFLFRFVHDKVQCAAIKEAVLSGNTHAVFQNTFIPLVRAWSGDEAAMQVCREMDIEGLIPMQVKILLPFKARFAKLESTADVVKLALEIYAVLKSPPPTPPPAPKEKPEPKPEPVKEEKPEEVEPPVSEDADTDTVEEPLPPDADESPKDEEAADAPPEKEEKEEGEEGDADDSEEGEPTEESGSESGEGEGEEGEPTEAEPDDSPEGGDMTDGLSSGDADASDEEEGGAAPSEGSEIGDEGEEEAAAAAERDARESFLEDCSAAAEKSDTGSIISDMVRDGITSKTYLPFTVENDVEEPAPYSERDIPALDAAVIRFEDEIRHMVGAMQGKMRRLFAQQENIAVQGGMRAGRLDASNLYRLRVGDDRVFAQRTEVHSTDTAVTLLIDLSGSMGGGKVKMASEAAYALSQTLDRLNITHEILGFTTKSGLTRGMGEEEGKLGRKFSRYEPLATYEFKRFDERTSIVTKRRLIAVSTESSISLKNNVDGESVLVAARRLKNQRHPRKIMMVLSDGEPAAYGDHTHLHNHLKFAVKECERMGIETIGIGIQTSAVTHYYPKSVVINRIEDLPNAVVNELGKFLFGKWRQS